MDYDQSSESTMSSTQSSYRYGNLSSIVNPKAMILVHSTGTFSKEGSGWKKTDILMKLNHYNNLFCKPLP